MDFSNYVTVRSVIFILSLCGLWVAWHIYHKKKTAQPLVCPIQFDCNTVVNSDYSRFMGIPVELLGMAYYGTVAVSYLLVIFFPWVWPSFLLILLVGLSLIAFAFSLYLIWVQIFALKKGCSWCFVSAILTTVIFILSLSANGFLG